MEIEKFKEILKKCKKADSTSSDNYSVGYDKENNVYILELKNKKICKCCKRVLSESSNGEMIIQFKENKDGLTIFEANMLYSVFSSGKIPRDFGGFLESPYGKSFIENINSVKGGLFQYGQIRTR